MPEKEMYFKVQFNDWDSYGEEKKNFIKFFMKDSTIQCGYPHASESQLPMYVIANQYSVDAWNNDNGGISFDRPNIESPTGLVQSTNHIGSYILGKPGRYDEIAELTIVPTIDGKVNIDTSAMPVIPQGTEFVEAPLQTVGNCNWQYRTSSFGITIGDNEMEFVHYKVGILDITEWPDSIKLNSLEVSHSNITAFYIEGENTGVSMNFSNKRYFPIRIVSKPQLYDSDSIRYLYIELCKDGGGYFDVEDITKDTPVSIFTPPDEETSEWMPCDWLNLIVAQNSNDNYLAGTTGGIYDV